MENKYLNLTGAVYIISKIKTLLEDKSDKGHTFKGRNRIRQC